MVQALTVVMLDTAATAHERRTLLEPGYSIGWHLTRTACVAGAILALALWLARDATLVDWLMLPMFWPVANLVEWTFHRFLMHRPAWPRMIYERHAIAHHRGFPHDAMTVQSTHELQLVMMPWYTILFVFLLGSPVAILCALVRGPALAGIFLVAAVAYFLTYELLHALYHLPAHDWTGLWFIPSRWLLRRRRHHAHHHRLERMAHCNFNVTFPWADRLLGTLEHASSDREP